MLGKITKSTVDKLPPGSLLWDQSLVGFGARRQRKDVFYLLRYRLNGKQRFYSIGRHGSPWTPDSARTEARRLLGLVASKTDPAAKLMSAGFGAEVLRYLDRKRPSMKPRSIKEVERHLIAHSKPLHALQLAAIDRRTIALLLGEIETGSGPVARNRVRASLSGFFNYCVAEGLAETNPVTGTGVANEGHSRDRTLSEGELTSLLAALGEDEFSYIIRMLILTGLRREEIGGLRWSEIKWDKTTLEGMIVLPPERTKNKRLHELPLSKQADFILSGRRFARRFTGDRSEWVWGRRWTKWSDNKAQLDSQLAPSIRESWRLAM